MKYAMLALLVIAAGCATTAVQGVNVNMRADPSSVFSKSLTVVNIDVDNRDVKSVYSVFVKIFDTGLLQGACEGAFERLLPNEFQTVSCRLAAPDVQQPMQTELNSLVSFKSSLSAIQPMQLMNENEYQRQVASGIYSPAPKSYSYRDNNVAIEVEFSEPPPIILAPGKKYFVYFTVTNAGRGFMGDLEPGDIFLRSVNPDRPLDILECSEFTGTSEGLELSKTLYPNGKVFPRLACEILTDSYLEKGFVSGEFVIGLNYKYELRNSLNVQIVK